MRIVALLLILASFSALAQDQISHLASEKEFTGYWRVLLISDELQKNKLKSEVTNEQSGFAGPCRFFINLTSGEWKNLTIENGAGAEESLNKCPSTKSAVDLYLIALNQQRSPYSWKSVPGSNGFFAVSSSENDGVLWKAEYVEKKIHAPEFLGFDLKEGDLVMTVFRLEPKVHPIWTMVLRPVQ